MKMFGALLIGSLGGIGCGAEIAAPGALISSPDRISFAGPGAGRAVTIFRRVGMSLLRASSAELSGDSDDPAVAVVRAGRIRPIGPGRTTIRFRAGDDEGAVQVEVSSSAGPFAAAVLSRAIGRGAGFGEDRFPEVVLGPPAGGGSSQGSTDVLSLGIDGSIELGFGALAGFDGPGPDLIVFENAFKVAGSERTFAEPGAVEVALGPGPKRALPCDGSGWPYRGCAGVQPVLAGPASELIDPADPTSAGGDSLDLSGVAGWIDRLAIHDLGGGANTGNNSGFDLDAVVLIHAAPAATTAIVAEPAELFLAAGEEVPLPRIDALAGARWYGLDAASDPLPAGAPIEIGDGLLRAVHTGTASLSFFAGPHRAVVRIEVSR